MDVLLINILLIFVAKSDSFFIIAPDRTRIISCLVALAGPGSNHFWPETVGSFFLGAKAPLYLDLLDVGHFLVLEGCVSADD